MSYSNIDSILLNWTKRHQLVLCSRYRDSDVRSIEIVDNAGKRYQIWIDEPENEHIGVHAWDYRRKRSDWSPIQNELEKCLDEALETVLKWCRS
jgi:hypothetical protein